MRTLSMSAALAVFGFASAWPAHVPEVIEGGGAQAATRRGISFPAAF